MLHQLNPFFMFLRAPETDVEEIVLLHRAKIA